MKTLAEKLSDFSIKQIQEVGENFGWLIGKVSANWENGFMNSTQKCKEQFRKKEVRKGFEDIVKDHFGEVNKMVEVNEEIKFMLKDCIYSKCLMSDCEECEFFNPKDTTDGIYFCAIRDEMGAIPYFREWRIESAFMKEKV